MVPPVEGDFTTELGESWEGANEPTGTDGQESSLNASSITSGLKAIGRGTHVRDKSQACRRRIVL